MDSACCGCGDAPMEDLESLRRICETLGLPGHGPERPSALLPSPRCPETELMGQEEDEMYQMAESQIEDCFRSPVVNGGQSRMFLRPKCPGPLVLDQDDEEMYGIDRQDLETLRQIGKSLGLSEDVGTTLTSPALAPKCLVEFISRRQHVFQDLFTYNLTQCNGQEPGQMTTEGGGSKSMIKTRTEDFARHLQKRLRSLSESEDGTWTASEDRPSFDTSSENETFFELDSNITSPEEEITEPDYIPPTNFVHDELLSDNVITEEPKLTKRDSADEQFYDTVDTSKESSPEIPDSVECPLVKPMLINFPIPLCASKEKNQCASSPDKYLVNGSIYLDADLSSSVNGACTEITECYKNSVIITCNGHITSASTESAENLSNETCDGLILNHKNLQYHLSEQKDLDDDLVEVNMCTKSCSQIESNCEQQNLENKRNEIKDTMNEQNINKLKSEENVSLTDLLQAIHKELKLEGKQTNGPLSVQNPEISISEVASENSGRSTSKNKEEEEEDIETRRMRFRRCSSLKSGKTPPGTPGRKKIVRFADVLGLDLADVKTFMDEVPTIPNSAYKDLRGVDSSILSNYDPFTRISQPMERRERVVIPLFQQPGGHPNFIEKVRELNVCLENAVVTDPSLLAITGTVRVKNIDFHKSVHIRYSLNGWKSFSDLQARYVPNSCDGFSDKFSFLMYAHTLNVGQRLEFAVRFQARGTQFWDNNGGVNYVFECVSQDNPCIAVVSNVPSSPTEAWPSFY